MTWVVTPTEIITFKVAGQPIARFPIAADVAKSIADSVATLSPDLGGKEYYGGVDGTMLRVSFSNDGALLPNGIECSNVWMPWLGPMIHKICRAIPTKFEMTYERKMAEQWKQWQSDLQFMGKPAPAQMEVMVKPLTAVYPPEAR